MTNAIYNRPKTMEHTASSFTKVRAAYNVFRNEKQFEIHLAIPGIPKEEVSIEAEENKLIVQHNKAEDSADKTLKVISKGFNTHGFIQKFNIPENVEVSSIAAEYNNGVLKIILPIKEKYHKKSIEVL